MTNDDVLPLKGLSVLRIMMMTSSSDPFPPVAYVIVTSSPLGQVKELETYKAEIAAKHTQMNQLLAKAKQSIQQKNQNVRKGTESKKKRRKKETRSNKKTKRKQEARRRTKKN